MIIGLLILILTLSAGLTACNFPQPSQTTPPDSPQQLTEIANILNPEGLPPEGTTEPAELSPTNPPPEIISVEGYLNYTTQQGDTLSALAARFGVSPAEISTQTPLPERGLLPIGTPLLIPDVLEEVLPYNLPILPDSEVVYSPSAQDFDVINSIKVQKASWHPIPNLSKARPYPAQKLSGLWQSKPARTPACCWLLSNTDPIGSLGFLRMPKTIFIRWVIVRAEIQGSIMN